MNEKIEKYFLGEMENSEKLEFLKELQTNKELQEEFASFQNTTALIALSDEVTDQNDTARNYQLFANKQKRKNTRRLLIQTLGYAASVAILMLSVHLYHIYNTTAETVYNTLHVPAGQRVSLTLQDGTVAWLNAQTKLTYPTVFSDKERRVTVEGEAYFEVTKNKEKPFIVSTERAEVKVLGTEFNVLNYPDEDFCRISLIEGSLLVSVPGSGSEGITMKPNEEITVTKNLVQKSLIQNDDYFLWTEGIYSFTNEPLKNILKRLEMYYDIKFEIKDSSILNWKYTGKFRQRDGIDEILRLMQRIHAFTVTKDEENNKIILDK